MISSSRAQKQAKAKVLNSIKYTETLSVKESPVLDFTRSSFFTPVDEHFQNVTKYYSIMKDPLLATRLEAIYYDGLNDERGSMVVEKLLDKLLECIGANICNRAAILEASLLVESDEDLVNNGLDALLLFLFCPAGLHYGVGGQCCTGANLETITKTIVDLHPSDGRRIALFASEMQQVCPRILKAPVIPLPTPPDTPPQQPLVPALAPVIDVGFPPGPQGIQIAPDPPNPVIPIIPEGPCTLGESIVGHQPNLVSLWIVKIILLLYFKAGVNIKNVLFFGSHVRDVVDCKQGVDLGSCFSCNPLITESLDLFQGIRVMVLSHPSNVPAMSEAFKRSFALKHDIAPLLVSRSKTSTEKTIPDLNDAIILEIAKRRNLIVLRELSWFLSSVGIESFKINESRIWDYQINSTKQANHLLHRPPISLSQTLISLSLPYSIDILDRTESRSLKNQLNRSIHPKKMHTFESDRATSLSIHADLIQNSMVSRAQVINPIVNESASMFCKNLVARNNGTPISVDVDYIAKQNNQIYHLAIGFSEWSYRMTSFRYTACKDKIGQALYGVVGYVESMYRGYYCHPCGLLFQVKSQNSVGQSIGNIVEVFGYSVSREKDLCLKERTSFVALFTKTRATGSKTSKSLLKNHSMRLTLSKCKSLLMCYKTGLLFVFTESIDLPTNLDCREDLAALNPPDLYGRLCASFNDQMRSVSIDLSSRGFYAGESNDIARSMVLADTSGALTRHIILSQWDSKNQRSFRGSLSKKEMPLIARQGSRHDFGLSKFAKEFSIYGRFEYDGAIDLLVFRCTRGLVLDLGCLVDSRFSDIARLNKGVINKTNRSFTVIFKDGGVVFKNIVTGRAKNLLLDSRFRNPLRTRIETSNPFELLDGIVH